MNARIARLKPKDAALLAATAGLLIQARLRLRVQKFESIVAWASRTGGGTEPVERLSWAMRAMSRRLPAFTCLAQALALQRLLSANGHRSELRIGVDRRNSDFSAHAWLVRDGVVLIGGDDCDRYRLLGAWPAGHGARGAQISDREPK